MFYLQLLVLESIDSRKYKYKHLKNQQILLTLSQKNTLVSGNADDEKNPHPGHRKFIFLIAYPKILSFLL